MSLDPFDFLGTDPIDDLRNETDPEIDHDVD
jgi:hypothetical protein